MYSKKFFDSNVETRKTAEQFDFIRVEKLFEGDGTK